MSHPPRDGEVYKTTCTETSLGFAILRGDGLVVNVENADGYFVEGRIYVWHVSELAAEPLSGDAPTAQSGD